jgi:RNA polymerase sigma-70 factor (ECF subfamily)
MVNDEIVARAVAGDSEAFRAIVENYEPRIYRFLYGLVRDPELARDLTQDTFESAYSAIGKTNGHLKLTAWLYTIARNHAMSEFRRRRIVSWVPLSKPSDNVAPDEAASEPPSREADMVDGIVERQALGEMLARLNAENRTLLILSSEGFTYAEIGQMVKLSEAAVRQRIFRARERLRTLYQEGGN